jgi:hypothetical protein
MLRKTQRRLLGVVTVVILSGILGVGSAAMWSRTSQGSINQQPPHWGSATLKVVV